MGTSSGAPERVPMVYYRVNTRVHILFFYSNKFVLLECPELAFWKADVDRMTFGRLFPPPPTPPVKNTFSISHVLFSFSLKTYAFLVTIHGYRCIILILTRPYLSNVLH